MSEGKYTPGPWTVNEYREVLDAQGRTICRVYLDGDRKPVATAKANARLMAAAPELLEALEATTAWIVELAASGDAGIWDGEDMDEVIAARAAIAKARGQS